MNEIGEKGEECIRVQDVEEGEISDTASIENTSEVNFVKPPSVAPSTKVSNLDPKHPRVWTMSDLLKYQNKYHVSRNYGPDLYNFAWAQAVQNKPLDDYLMMEFTRLENSTNSKKLSSSKDNKNDVNANVTVSSSSKEKELDDKAIIYVSSDEADEREEGELEEGEIDFDMDVVKIGEEEGNLKDNELSAYEDDVKVDSLMARISLIREGLEAMTPSDAEKSFDEVVSRLQNLLDCLSKVVEEASAAVRNGLLQQTFSAICIIYSVFCSLSEEGKDQSRGRLLRLLACVTSRKPCFFSHDQMKEVESMIMSTDSPSGFSIAKGADDESGIEGTVGVNYDGCPSQNLTSLRDCSLEAHSSEYLHQNDCVKNGMPSSKSRVMLPILDLHKDHDLDSLPSPTRQMPSQFPLDNQWRAKDVVRPEWPVLHEAFETPNSAQQSYETDAFKAVSTYQQKFGGSSFLMNSGLPSPTPSEESGDACDDTGGEVSSHFNVRNGHSIMESTTSSGSVSSSSEVDILSGQVLINARNSMGSNLNNLTKIPSKRRDPRLLSTNSDGGRLDLNQCLLPRLNNQPAAESIEGIVDSRKQKFFYELVQIDGHAVKRQKSEVINSASVRDVPAISQSSNWLEDRSAVGLPPTNRNHFVDCVVTDSRGSENTVKTYAANNVVINDRNNGSEHGRSVIDSTASVQSLLKDIAVNPAMWMNILKMEQEKSVDPRQCTKQSPSSNSLLGADPIITVSPPKTSLVGRRLAGTLQASHPASWDGSGKIRMKSRDPRRALQNNALRKSGIVVSPQPNSNGSTLQGTKGNLKQEERLDQISVVTKSMMPPDIAPQFTKNLKNIADMMSVSQAIMTMAVPPIPSAQEAQVHASFVNVRGILSEAGNLLSGTGQTSEEVSAGASQPQNTWSDVEHLFERFDDQQKAAIQRERARRIEEQKKMFASRKLCLVLDLDHTLLNSAKFSEVEPIHDEMLRKKEEQDREKPQRHLFRFLHMGMWTKLRPGIWNFLEKASKLYELHLYTMGNKLYATEMAKVLDPKGNLFNGRVISRGDDGDPFDGDERVPKSKDLEGVLGMESAVVIIDDSVRVWPHNKLNLIVVERYIYFPCSRHQFGLPGPSLLEIDHDERPEDGTLASSLAVIERIHRSFYLQQSLDGADVRNILASEQRKILGGCRIVFSRVFPVGEANPHLHPLWQTAEQFGAVCTSQIDEQVTHVVANSLGTDKVNWALSTGRFVVHPGWVEASALLYRRANEHEFAVKP